MSKRGVNMADIYTFNSNIDAHEDCSLSSNIIGGISAGESISSIRSI